MATLMKPLDMHRKLASLICIIPIMLWTHRHVTKIKLDFVPFNFCVPRTKLSSCRQFAFQGFQSSWM
jgi:hypothetical protein